MSRLPPRWVAQTETGFSAMPTLGSLEGFGLCRILVRHMKINSASWSRLPGSIAKRNPETSSLTDFKRFSCDLPGMIYRVGAYTLGGLPGEHSQQRHSVQTLVRRQHLDICTISLVSFSLRKLARSVVPQLIFLVYCLVPELEKWQNKHDYCNPFQSHVAHGNSAGAPVCLGTSTVHETERAPDVLHISDTCFPDQLTVRLVACEDDTLRWVRDWTRKFTQEISGQVDKPTHGERTQVTSKPGSTSALPRRMVQVQYSPEVVYSRIKAVQKS